MSHLPDGKPLKVALTVTRGKRAPYVVEPLPDSAPTSPAVSAETLAELTALFEQAQIPEADRLAGVNRIVRGSATALETITEEQAQVVLTSLRKRVGPRRPAAVPTAKEIAEHEAALAAEAAAEAAGQ